jgi:hypothetical protein
LRAPSLAGLTITWLDKCCLKIHMTQADIQNAHAARAERAHLVAIDQLRDKLRDNRSSTWREAYIAAFTTYWVLDELSVPLPDNGEPLAFVVGERRIIVE